MITKYYSIASHVFTTHYNPVHPSYKVLEWGNRAWGKECGALCPTMERKTIGDLAAASFLWNPHYSIPPSKHPTTDSLLADNIISWKFNTRCNNIRCDNYSPDHSTQLRIAD